MAFARFLIFFLMALAPTLAHAHWGHVGELAGHGHIIGIGALAGAAALAAALRKPRRDKSEEQSVDAEAEDETAENAEGVAA